MPLGWAPRYLVTDLLKAMSSAPVLNAKVVKANSPSTPINRRYLIEMSGKLPPGVEPMSGADYQPIH